MANYPSTISAFINPSPTDKLSTTPHSSIETAQNTDLIAIETFVGTLSSNVGTLVYDIRGAGSNGGGHVQTVNKGGTGQTSYTKGDVLVAQSSSVLTKLAVGTDAFVLTADSTQSLGLNWAAAAFTPGMVMMYGVPSAPSGWLNCNGAAYAISSYVSLYNTIGSVYGGNSVSSVFNVPNYSSRVPIGIGSALGGGIGGIGSVAGGATLSTIVTAQWKGEETHVLTTTELASHTHNVGLRNDNPTAGAAGLYGSSSANNAAFASGSAGSDGAHNNIQPVLGINFIIKT